MARLTPVNICGTSAESRLSPVLSFSFVWNDSFRLCLALSDSIIKAAFASALSEIAEVGDSTTCLYMYTLLCVQVHP